MTFDEYRNQLEVKLLQKAAEFVEVGDIDECKNCISGIEELNRVLSTLGNNPRQEGGDTNTDAIESKPTEEQTDEKEPTEPGEVNPTHPGGDFDLDDAIEYVKTKLSLTAEEEAWLDESEICKASDPKYAKITNHRGDVLTPDSIRKSATRGKIRYFSVSRTEFAYYRYSILLYAKRHSDPWPGKTDVPHWFKE